MKRRDDSTSAERLGRVARFESEIARIEAQRIRAGHHEAGTRLGVFLLLMGVASEVVAYLVSHRTTDVLTQGDATMIAALGISVSIAGAAVYLRYGLSQFLRLWLARLIYENATARDAAPSGPTRGLGDDEESASD